MNKTNMIIGTAISEDGTDAIPTVIFGLHPATWDAMATGHTQTADLTKIGIPATILIFRGASYDDTIATLSKGAIDAGMAFTDHRGGKAPLPDLGAQTTTWKRGEFVEVKVPEVMGGGSGECLQVLAVGQNKRGKEHVLVENSLGLVAVRSAEQLRYWNGPATCLDLMRKPK